MHVKYLSTHKSLGFNFDTKDKNLPDIAKRKKNIKIDILKVLLHWNYCPNKEEHIKSMPNSNSISKPKKLAKSIKKKIPN